MKLLGPVMLICGGLALCGLVRLAQNGPVDHNIGRSIGTAVIQNGLMVVGGAVAVAGAIWLLLRFLGRNPVD